MANRRAAPPGEPYREEGQSRGDGRFDQNGRGGRTAGREQDLADNAHHGCFFLSVRTRAISSWSAASSASVQEPSATRAVIICRREPPKNVCRYCCKAVRLATAGAMVAE